MDYKNIIEELKEIKKELQDIRSILEPKEVEISLDGEKISRLISPHFANPSQGG